MSSLSRRMLRLSLDDETGTILFWVNDFGKQTVSPTTFTPELREVVYWGESPANMSLNNSDSFFYAPQTNSIQEWKPGENKHTARCALLKAKCASMYRMHRRITHRRLEATKLMGQGEVYARKAEEARRYLATAEPDIARFSFLEMAARHEGRDDYAGVARNIALRADEYEAMLLQTEELRMTWTKAVCAAETLADLQKVTDSLNASAYLGS